MISAEAHTRNLAGSLSFYGKTCENNGMMLITACVDYSVFNIAILTEPLAYDHELDEMIDRAERHYAKARRAWSFWVCEDFLSRKANRRIFSVFDDRDMSCIAEPPGMELADFPAAHHDLPLLDYRQVTNAATRRDFTRLATECFQIPPPIGTAVYGDAEPWNAPIRMWLGYEDGVAVTSAATVVTPSALGIYSVGTLPRCRRRGCAEAVMRHAVAQARATGSRAPLILQSSPAGLSLYRGLGFRRTTGYRVFATRATTL